MSEKRRATQKRYYERHKLRIRARKRTLMAKYRSTEGGLASNREAARRFRREHPATACANAANRRANKLSATPPWLTDEHWAAIEEVYEKRQANQHVDHIIPLKGDSVCGLHVPWNLQLISKEENLKKGNKF